MYICNIMNLENRRHIASWMLLAVFVPMLVFSSLHIHEASPSSVADTQCAECNHHNCDGHLAQTASWVHDCVLCQFQTFSMLTAVVVAVTVYVYVCGIQLARPFCDYSAAIRGVNVTRGPPSTFLTSGF